jgi:uncharacterized protein (TIGR02270 family)
LVPSSEILAAALATDHIGLQRAALQSLRHRARDAHRRDGEPEVTDAHLHASDPDVRDAAIETGLMRGLPAAWDRCTSLLAEPMPDAGNALLLAALLGPEPIQQRLASAVASPSSCRAALFALGFAGTRAAAETCLEAMALEPVAALAAEAFSGITGLDLAAEGMVIQPEPEPELAPEEEDVRPVITPNEEDLLPRPERSRVTSWWDRQRGRFVAGRRYLDGMPVSLEVLEAVLSHGSMRRRAPIALELAVRTAGRCHVDPRAFASVQRQQMTQVRQISVDSIRRAPLAGVYSQI